MVLTDIRMPPSYTDEGIRAAGRFAESDPGLGVVVLSVVDPKVVDVLVRPRASSPLDRLSPREREALALVAAKTNASRRPGPRGGSPRGWRPRA
jgi:hypothetical protein